MGGILSASLMGLLCALAISCSKIEDETVGSLLREHNARRADKGLEPLVLDTDLCEYAQEHADKMAKKGLLVHSSMSNLGVRAGNGNVAENIAWGQNSVEEVCRSWMKSPGHRANILGKRYKRVGFGVKEDERGRKYWCSVFAA
jgi:uncharacterized protein YkwD